MKEGPFSLNKNNNFFVTLTAYAIGADIDRLKIANGIDHRLLPKLNSDPFLRRVRMLSSIRNTLIRNWREVDTFAVNNVCDILLCPTFGDEVHSNLECASELERVNFRAEQLLQAVTKYLNSKEFCDSIKKYYPNDEAILPDLFDIWKLPMRMATKQAVRGQLYPLLNDTPFNCYIGLHGGNLRTVLSYDYVLLRRLAGEIEIPRCVVAPESIVAGGQLIKNAGVTIEETVNYITEWGESSHIHFVVDCENYGTLSLYPLVKALMAHGEQVSVYLCSRVAFVADASEEDDSYDVSKKTYERLRDKLQLLPGLDLVELDPGPTTTWKEAPTDVSVAVMATKLLYRDVNCKVVLVSSDSDCAGLFCDNSAKERDAFLSRLMFAVQFDHVSNQWVESMSSRGVSYCVLNKATSQDYQDIVVRALNENQTALPALAQFVAEETGETAESVQDKILSIIPQLRFSVENEKVKVELPNGN